MTRPTPPNGPSKTDVGSAEMEAARVIGHGVMFAAMDAKRVSPWLDAFAAALWSRFQQAQPALDAVRRDAAREALTKCARHLGTNTSSCSVLRVRGGDHGFAYEIVEKFRDREYPATGEEPTGGDRYECSADTHGSFCDPRCTLRHTDAVVRTVTAGVTEPLCDQCRQPLGADASRDHDHPTRHTIRGCIRALASRPTASGEG